MNIDLSFRVVVKDARGGDAISDSSSLIETNIVFKTKTFKVSDLKLSEVRTLIGASATYREIEAMAYNKRDTGDNDIPYFTQSVTQEVFIAWAKTFGNSQALAILNVTV
tara:strand:+ start:279 stop:605 length:327 start_codon:yes stop_codon:yes gene_type:complete